MPRHSKDVAYLLCFEAILIKLLQSCVKAHDKKVREGVRESSHDSLPRQQLVYKTTKRVVSVASWPMTFWSLSTEII